MIIFLYGQDSYRISQKLNELIHGYRVKNPSGLNLMRFDFAEDNSKDFFDKINQQSIIQEKKLVILKNISKTEPESFLEFLKSRNFDKREGVILIIVEVRPLLGGRTSELENELFNFLIKKPNQAQKFELLKEYEIKSWIRKLLNANNIEIASDALDFLIANRSSDLWRLDNEIRKIADYSAQGGSPPEADGPRAHASGGKIKGIINKSQLEDLIISSAEQNIFELTDALAKKDKKRALSALYRALDNGEKPTELLGLLAWRVRNLLRFKNSVKPQELRLHPFVLEKTKEAAEFFSADELSAILSKIIDLDLSFKTSDIDAKSALSLLISEL